MTDEEALQLIELPVGADSATMRRRLEVLVSDYQVRLTNAPTTALQQLYRGKLHGLETARALLLAEMVGAADLPGLGPTDETAAESNPESRASGTLITSRRF